MAYWNIDLPTSQWKRAKVFLANAASFVVKNPLSTVTIVILVASSIVVTRELSRDIALIEPIDLPPFVQDLGLTENVAAFRLRDSILRILREVNREGLESQIAFLSRGGQESHIAFLPTTEKMDFEIPGLDLSFHSVLVITKQFLGLQEMKIAGEFVCSPPDLGWTCPGRENIRLRLRIIGGSKDDFIDLHNLSSKTFSRYFTEAAEKVLLLLDPYTLARHYYLRSLKCKTVDELLHCYESKEGYQKEAERIASMLTEPSGKFRGLGFELRALLATQFRPDAFVDELFKKAVHNAPSDLKAQVLNSWGVVLSRRDDYQAAIEKYRTSIKYKTDFAVAYQNWGYALAQQGAYREAYDRYTKAIKIEPDYAIAYYNRGISLRRLCAFERAADDYRTAVEIDQDYRVAYSALGFVLRRLQRFEEGDVAYERAVELDSDAARTPLNWGVLWLDFAEYKRRNGDLQGASTAIVKSEKILERSLNVDPEYDRAHFYMGRLQELGGDFESALRSYKDGLGREIRDDDDKSALAEVHSKLASVLIKVGGAADAEAHRSASEQLIASVQVHEPCR